MARIRNIKPSFFTDARMFRLDRDTGLPVRLAYVGLWLMCDREGRFVVDYDELKVQIFPYEPAVDMEAIMAALVEAGRIVIYEVAGVVYCSVPKFTAHQFINGNEAASTLPAPPSESAPTAKIEPPQRVPEPPQGVPDPVVTPIIDAPPTREVREDHASSAREVREGDALSTREDREDHASSTGDDQASNASLRKGKERKGKEDSNSDDLAIAFEEFWKVYPPRAGGRVKAESLIQYRRSITTAAGTVEEILEGARRYRLYCEAAGKINTELVQQAARWLNPKNKGWEEDWTPPTSSRKPAGRNPGKSIQELAAERRARFGGTES